MKFKIKYKIKDFHSKSFENVGKYFQTPCGNIMQLGNFFPHKEKDYYDTITIMNTYDKKDDFAFQTALTSVTYKDDFIILVDSGMWIILTRTEIDNILKDPVEYYKHYKLRF